jgi:hypothetical protein
MLVERRPLVRRRRRLRCRNRGNEGGDDSHRHHVLSLRESSVSTCIISRLRSTATGWRSYLKTTPRREETSVVKPTLFAIATILPLLAGVIPTAHAVECAAGVVRAGCAGPNGAVVAGPRGAAAVGTNGMRMRSAPRAGTTATGARGNTATKAVAPGCAFVNGERVCR